ncbi:hypothetical protein [Noviherbaspirillum pedocola]|uniref:Uncharacterized protein n=1 Tax=Noviherbaspirillum pedocola TaxID=2801341 RepID=A0A934SU24_9BURK|nr:hypothetical protein [Noviherbaspirillum pedocola]MBK4735228.1 hypothetical protein [Noviherbaspirillum pedocola]
MSERQRYAVLNLPAVPEVSAIKIVFNRRSAIIITFTTPEKEHIQG